MFEFECRVVLAIEDQDGTIFAPKNCPKFRIGVDFVEFDAYYFGVGDVG